MCVAMVHRKVLLAPSQVALLHLHAINTLYFPLFINACNNVHHQFSKQILKKDIWNDILMSFKYIINVFERQPQDVISNGQTIVLSQKSENHLLSSTFALSALSTQKYLSKSQNFPHVWRRCKSLHGCQEARMNITSSLLLSSNSHFQWESIASTSMSPTLCFLQNILTSFSFFLAPKSFGFCISVHH